MSSAEISQAAAELVDGGALTDERIARALAAHRAGAEAAREALLDDMADLAAKLAESEARWASLPIGEDSCSPDALEAIRLRGVNATFHVEERAEFLRTCVASASAHRRLSQADTIRAFVLLEDAHRRLAEADEALKASEDASREAVKAAQEDAARDVEEEIDDLEDKLDDEKRARAKAEDALEEANAKVERLVLIETIDLPAKQKEIASLETALADSMSERMRIDAERAFLADERAALNARVGPIVKAWVEVVAPTLRNGGADGVSVLDLASEPLLVEALKVTP